MSNGDRSGESPTFREDPSRATSPVSAPPHELAPGGAPPSRMPLGPGSFVKHYEILRELGQGGMGSVFLARDTRLARLCAIKLLRAYSGEGAERLLAEARATARCKHENIVVIHEVDEIRGYPYMVLEYVEGRTLRAWMNERGGPLGVAPSMAVELMIPVLRALACAHEMGIAHRDLKPENVLLTDAGQVKVVDFGIAKRLGVDELASTIPAARASDAEAPEGRSGTPAYMSPEQWLLADVDHQSDIWAAGIMLYELCTGAHPLAPVSAGQLQMVQDLEIPMPSVRERRPDVGALGAVVDRCLAKRKSERIASARELLAEIEPLLRGRKASEPTEEDSPFPGLSSFQESDAARFFGRDRDVIAVLGRLRHQPLVVVAGPSGAGKSSFVRAGVIPALKRFEGSWEAFLLRPGRRPLAAMADVLAQAVEIATERRADVPHDEGQDDLAATLRSRPGHLGACLRARCRRLGGGHRILLFVDQLEELYTLAEDPDTRAAFLACLEGVADDASSPLRVALAVRSDFLDRMAGDRHFMTEVTRGLVFLPPMGREGLRDALTKPVDAAGVRYEGEALVEQMLEALESARSPLPLLQFTAARLWDARDRDRRLLTHGSYRALGGVSGALSTHADAVLSALSPVDQRLARSILPRLVTPERTRAIVSMAELREIGEGGEAAEQIVHYLAGARLLLVETGAEREGSTVELVHESLIDRWAKLRRWLDEDEQDARFLAQLRAAAQPWDASGEAEGLLWRDRAAEDARQWLERRRAARAAEASFGLGKREERYLLAVIALADRRRRLRRRAVTGVIAVLGAIAVAVSYLAIRADEQARRADEQAARAQAEARQARNATRMAAARERQADPTTMLALLREIEPPDAPRGWSELSRAALGAGVARAVLDHSDVVRSAAFSPDGKRIVTASADRTARVWSADGAGQPLVLRGHEDTVYSAAFSPDGERIVTASADRTARVWSADGTGEPLVLRGHEDWVRTATFSPDGERIVTGSNDHSVRVWSADGAGQHLVLRGHEGPVLSAAWSSDGKRIVTACSDRTARVWNADGTGQRLVLRGHGLAVWSAAFSPDGERIVTASDDETARVFSADGKRQLLVLKHDKGLSRAAWSPDGQRIVTSSDDTIARVYRADGTGEPLRLRGHGDRLWSAAFSPDGQRVITASVDRTARVWSVDGAGRPLVFRGHEQEVTSATFSPDGSRILTASADRTARVWSADGTGPPLVLRGHGSGLFSAAFSRDGKRILTGSEDGTARLWSADGTGDPVVLRRHGAGVLSAAWSPDGTRILTAPGDESAVWVSRADGTGEPLVLRGHEASLKSATWSPDGGRIVTASSDKTARVWGTDGAGGPLAVLRGHDAIVLSAAWSPDGKRIATGGHDRTVRVWSADGRSEPLILRGHEEPVRSAAWSPDGKRIAAASRTVRVWNADGTGEPLVLAGAEQAYNAAAWSPDGERIVAASDDGTVWVWTDLEPLSGLDDPKLWTASAYCMPIERRIELMNIHEATARAHLQACERRVDEARAAARSR
ncbi:nSTAND1 domain-containing NTPase [Sorangium sp. So ce861]|uniref:nSTAND1 domain-containing NTPase n=1 Tax=Sorangium sp. So ce861 TaxID=3133323 RepID=UPI003F5E2813